MGVLKGAWPFEGVKMSTAQTGMHLNLVLPHAPIPPAPH